MRITNNGNFVYCRWSDKYQNTVNIRDVEPADFFQQHMAALRYDLLQGRAIPACGECYQMEQHGKVSGRQRQLLKTGVRVEHFEKTMLSSPWRKQWQQDFDKQGVTNQLPQDWQIDLGNYCNSACIFCTPGDSSRLAAEWKRIGFIDQLPGANWTDDPKLVDKFVEILKQSSHIQYLHFIGGETVIIPAFKKILQTLVDCGLNHKATVGFTTNLTVWDQETVDLLTQFAGVHLGMSVECFDPLNDYVRWPSNIDTVITTRDRWIEVGKKHNWLMQFRTTPTALSISKLLTVYDYAWENNLVVESCNFLQHPEWLRPAVLPNKYRLQIVEKMQSWIDQRGLNNNSVVNFRDPTVTRTYLVQDLQSYVNYFKQETDQSDQLFAMVSNLQKIETSRKNSILNYLPEYEQLLRSAGY